MPSGRGSVALVGVGESDLGQVPPGTTAVDLMAQATLRALEDCGMRLSDIDAVFSASSALPMAPLNLAEYLHLSPRYVDGTQVGGAAFASHVNHARVALEAGACEVALIVHGSTQRSTGRANAAPQEVDEYEAPYRPLLPISAYALAASRHMHEFGTTAAHLAEVAVAARTWASPNPKAWSRQPLTVDDVLASRPVSTPLKVRDCCLVTDGGAAIILVRSDQARGVHREPIFVLGAGEATSHRHISNMPDLTTTAAVQSGARAYAMAQMTASDIDVVQLYDAFTITPILFLEDLGFCPKGDGGPFVEGGKLRLGGDLPLNTNGGGLSYQHPGMYGLMQLVEAVRQLRGESGARQVDQHDTALVHSNGGVLSSQCTVILGTEQALG
jgi:acetyl-CoA acetyltransferase